MNQISFKERISNMEILNGGKLTAGQLKVVTENKITTIIEEQIYLGSLADAWDLAQLRSYKITHIFQVLFKLMIYKILLI
jgi:hypothetical protein